jgi:hypothetical protein
LERHCSAVHLEDALDRRKAADKSTWSASWHCQLAVMLLRDLAAKKVFKLVFLHVQ